MDIISKAILIGEICRTVKENISDVESEIKCNFGHCNATCKRNANSILVKVRDSVKILEQLIEDSVKIQKELYGKEKIDG